MPQCLGQNYYIATPFGNIHFTYLPSYYSLSDPLRIYHLTIYYIYTAQLEQPNDITFIQANLSNQMIQVRLVKQFNQ